MRTYFVLLVCIGCAFAAKQEKKDVGKYRIASFLFLSSVDICQNWSSGSTISVKRFAGPDMGPNCLWILSAWADRYKLF